MLNELYHLSIALEQAGIMPVDWHKDLKPLPNASDKKPCHRIFISSDGSIAGIEPMKKELVACLRKWEPSLGNSFPGFNIQPLYRLADEDKKKRLRKWKDGKEPVDRTLLKEWCAEEKVKNWDAKSDKKMDKCLRAIPRELQEKCADIPNDFSALKDLFERITKLGNGRSAEFFQSLDSYIWRSLEKNDHSLALLSVLIHEGSSRRRPEDDRGSVSVFLDVPDWTEYPVAHEKTIQCINEYLKSGNTSNTKTGDKKEDAFGSGSGGDEDKLPEVRLPYIGRVILRAMTKESPCQYRYGTVDAASFRIGADSRKRVKGALEWLSDNTREGETWGRADRRELIFAYPAILPNVPLKLASCLGAHKTDDTEARFENYAKDVVDCLKGMAPSLKDIDLRVFSLRKMDDTSAKTKVVFHRNYSAQRLADAAKEWRQGCANIPTIRIKSWGDEKGKTVVADPVTPFPLQIAECLNLFWKMEGSVKRDKKTVKKGNSTPYPFQAIPKTAGIELMLDEFAAQRKVSHLLTLALQNGKGLFLSLGNSLHRDDEVIKLDGVNKHKQLMPAILGLLLWKIGIGKESYMNNPPYLVGRILKIADELHAVYCKEVRKNNLPPQLLGNALMVAALDSPTQALAQLALRIAPYLGWARTNSTASAGLSRYFLKEFGRIEIKLRDAVLPDRLDDAARAQLLLGYISGNPQTEEPTNN